MRPERSQTLYLSDILEAADYIAQFIAGTDFNGFLRSELLRSAVVQKLAVIGEADARVPRALQDRNPQVPWPQIIELRRSVACILAETGE